MVRKPARSIVAAIGDAARRWSDRDFAPRLHAREAAAARTGYSLPVVDHAFDTLFGSLRADAIESVIDDEIGGLAALDGFVARTGRSPARALPVGRVCVVSSRTTIGVAIVPAAFALCAGCDVTVKDREDRLAAAFFETVAAAAPHAAVKAQAWDGRREAGKLAGFDAVVAFGDDATLAAIARDLPHPTRLIAYGSKASAGYVEREALDGEAAAAQLADRAASDAVLYDGEGCLSLHALFVERGGAVGPQAFGKLLLEAMRDAAVRLGVAPHDARAAAKVALARDVAAFRARDDALASDGNVLVVVDAPPDEPPPFLPRVVALRSVDSPADAAAYLTGHGIALEALAVGGSRSDIVAAAVATGAARITRFGSLQRPPLGTFHGGRPRIAEFVRWLADET